MRKNRGGSGREVPRYGLASFGGAARWRYRLFPFCWLPRCSSHGAFGGRVTSHRLFGPRRRAFEGGMRRFAAAGPLPLIVGCVPERRFLLLLTVGVLFF